MRRTLAYGFGVASVPVGTGLGLWMAAMTNLPPCPVRGLGTANLCAPQPAFAQSACVLFGAAAAAVLLLLAIAVGRPSSWTGAFDLAAAGVGIVIGVWASLIVASPAGLGGLSFTPLESALIGAAAAAAILALGCIASSDVRRVNLDTALRARGWLFKDLSMRSAVDGHETNAG